MSGQTLTIAGCILSFAMLFGIYMSLRGDFMIKMKEHPMMPMRQTSKTFAKPVVVEADQDGQPGRDDNVCARRLIMCK